MIYKKIILLFILLLATCTCVCCKMGNAVKRPHESFMSLFDRMEKEENDCVETAIKSLKSGDKETFKKIFADSVVIADNNFDKKVDDVFDFIEGNIVDYEIEGMSPESSDGKEYIYLSDSFYCIIKTDIDDYTIHFKYKMTVTYYLRKIKKSGVYLFEVLNNTAAENSEKSNFFRDTEGVYVIKP